jgi:putative ABC transport system permease protein
MLRESLVLTGVGLVAGWVLSLGAARLLSSLLYEVSAMDPLVFVGATAFLASAAGLASYLPVRRAIRIEPTAALRHE